VVTDITEQAESEAELVRAKATLEKRVAERTEQLTRLNDALERANRSGRGGQHLEDAIPGGRRP
jgi:C4-dicarboxylate-specific signal transduction histidine kinase